MGVDKIEDLLLEHELMKGVERFKYLGVTLNKYGHSDEEITLRSNKGRNYIGALNSLLWIKNVRYTKKRLYSTVFKSTVQIRSVGNKRKTYTKVHSSRNGLLAENLWESVVG
jgi:hypothetical protein